MLTVLLCGALTGVSAQEHNFLNNIYDYLENTSVFELNQEEGHIHRWCLIQQPRKPC
jgi:hypothetical protein